MEGLERIKILAAEVKDKALLKIVKYLLSRTDMNDKFLNEEKSLTQMVEFIKGKAKEKAENGMAMIEDEVVYSWAIHYFDENNKDLKLNACTKLKDLTETSNDNISSNLQEQELHVKKAKKNWVPEGQLSLF